MTSEIKPIKIISARELLNKEFTEPNWLVENLVPNKSMTIIGGAPASYKSFLCQYMAVCIASGTKFVDHYETTKSKVLVIEEENNERNIQRRIKKILNGLGNEVNLSNLKFSIHSELKFDDKCIARIDEAIKNWKPEVIIFDSYIRFSQGDEDKASMVKLNHEKISSIINKYDCTVIVIHHLRKAPKGTIDDFRGSGDIGAYYRSGIILKKKNRSSALEVIQVKNSDSFEVQFQLKILDTANNGILFKMINSSNEKSHESKIDEFKKQVLDNMHYDFPYREREILELIGLERRSSYLSKALKELVQEKKIEKKTEGWVKYQSKNSTLN